MSQDQSFKLKNKLPPFTQIPNDLITGPLSPLAKATYCYLASRPDGWDFWFTNIVATMHTGVSSIKKALKDLANSGWIDRQQSRDGGRWGATIYQINYTPSTSPRVENRATVAVPPLPSHGNNTAYKERLKIKTKNKDNSLSTRKKERDTFQNFKAKLLEFCPNFIFCLPKTMGYINNKGFALKNDYIFNIHSQKFLEKNESFTIWQYLYSIQNDVFELAQAQINLETSA